MPRKKSTEIQEELLQTVTEESKAGTKPRKVSTKKKDASFFFAEAFRGFVTALLSSVAVCSSSS